jgi:hypothetical protein
MSACQDPVPRLRYHTSQAWDSIKHLSAEHGGTAPAMMWRNGRFLPHNGAAAPFWPRPEAGYSASFPVLPASARFCWGSSLSGGLPGAEQRDAEAAGRSALMGWEKPGQS